MPIRFGIATSSVRVSGRHDAYDYLHLPRTSKSVYCRQAGLDLVLLDSNRASLTTDTLGIDRAALDELRADRLVNRDDLSRQWPTRPREAADIEGRTQRQQLLRDLNDQVKLLGLDLGGEMPPQGGGAPR